MAEGFKTDILDSITTDTVAIVSDEKQAAVDTAVEAQLKADGNDAPYDPDWVIGNAAAADERTYGYSTDDMPDLLNGVNDKLKKGQPSYSFAWDDDFADTCWKDTLESFKSRIALKVVL